MSDDRKAYFFVQPSVESGAIAVVGPYEQYDVNHMHSHASETGFIKAFKKAAASCGVTLGEDYGYGGHKGDFGYVEIGTDALEATKAFMKETKSAVPTNLKAALIEDQRTRFNIGTYSSELQPEKAQALQEFLQQHTEISTSGQVEGIDSKSPGTKRQNEQSI